MTAEEYITNKQLITNSTNEHDCLYINRIFHFLEHIFKDDPKFDETQAYKKWHLNLVTYGPEECWNQIKTMMEK